jgi:hypothetical protein
LAADAAGAATAAIWVPTPDARDVVAAGVAAPSVATRLRASAAKLPVGYWSR